jgi:hypothetical protein
MGGGGVKSYDGEKAYSSTNTSILSGLHAPICNLSLTVLPLTSRVPVFGIRNGYRTVLLNIQTRPLTVQEEQNNVLKLLCTKSHLHR